MLVKCQAIVIKTINYSESSVILKCFTSEHGLHSYMINGVRGKKGQISPSQLMPLSLLELETYHQQNKNLQRIKELKCWPVLNNIHFDMVKSSVGIFIAELLHKVLIEENQQDKPMFDFLFNAIQILDLSKQNIANFPCYFMIHLCKYFGFMPKQNYSPTNNSFNTIEGLFVPWRIGINSQIEPTNSNILHQLMQASFNTFSHVEINKIQRVELLQILIQYYQTHLMGFSDLKSHKVLAEVL